MTISTLRTTTFLALVALAAPAHAQNAVPAGGTRQTTSPPPEFRSITYARLGYGAAFGDPLVSAPAIGFGYRGEVESFALDISFFNYIVGIDRLDRGRNVAAGSLLKLQGLRFLDGGADRSVYIGAGMSWARVSAGRADAPGGYSSGWHGSGLQGEFTTGYGSRGRSPLRMFVQADVSLPFFKATSNTFTVAGPGRGFQFQPTAAVDRRWIPSAAVSLGIGWDTRRRKP